jgi:hypothetical protein
MTNKDKRYDDLLAGEIAVSFINEPFDFTVVEAVREETAEERARRKWGMQQK